MYNFLLRIPYFLLLPSLSNKCTNMDHKNFILQNLEYIYLTPSKSIHLVLINLPCFRFSFSKRSWKSSEVRLFCYFVVSRFYSAWCFAPFDTSDDPFKDIGILSRIFPVIAAFSFSQQFWERFLHAIFPTANVLLESCAQTIKPNSVQQQSLDYDGTFGKHKRQLVINVQLTYCIE